MPKNKKKKTWVRKRHLFFYNLARPMFKRKLKRREGFITTKEILPDKPCLIVSNHVTTFDPFKIALTTRKMVYFVLSDDILSRKFLGPLLSWGCNPIPKSKSVSDMRCVKIMLQVLKEGSNVMVFAEGNRTYNGELCHVDKSIAKLVKLSKVPLVIYNMIGNYASDPRWASDYRKGECYAKIVKTIYPDEYDKYSIDELYDIIVSNMKVNEPTPSIKDPNRALFLERVMYRCPDCNNVNTLHSQSKYVYCDTCDFKVLLNEDLTFSKVSGNNYFKTIPEWYNFQQDIVKSFDISNLKDDEEIYFEENVNLFQVIKCKTRKYLIKNGRLSMTKNEIKVVKNVNDNKLVSIPIESIEAGCCVMKNKANFIIGNMTYQIKGDERFNALKYVEMFNHIKNELKGLPHEDEFLGL